jgi:hypothetical protein
MLFPSACQFLSLLAPFLKRYGCGLINYTDRPSFKPTPCNRRLDENLRFPQHCRRHFGLLVCYSASLTEDQNPRKCSLYSCFCTAEGKTDRRMCNWLYRNFSKSPWLTWTVNLSFCCASHRFLKFIIFYYLGYVESVSLKILIPSRNILKNPDTRSPLKKIVTHKNFHQKYQLILN